MPAPDGSSGCLRGRLGAVLGAVAVLLSALVFVDERLVALPVLVGLVAAGLAVLQVRADRAVGAQLRRYALEVEEAVEQTFCRAAIPIAMHFPDGTMRANRITFEQLNIPYINGPFTYADLPARALTATGELDLVRHAQGQPDRFMVNHSFQLDDGRLVHIDMHANVVRDAHGAVRWVAAYGLNVTDRHLQAEELRRRLREDTLTGLLNRSAFQDDLLALLGDDRDAVVIYVDIDMFTKVNDNYGHATGDAVLRILTERLRKLAPSGALIARLGGDEFALALPGTMQDGERLGAAIIESCEAPFRTPGGLLPVTVSVGVSRADHAGQAEQAVLSADTAMLVAKQTGRDRLRTFDEQMKDARERRYEAETMLRTAIFGDRSTNLPVWYQPIVAVDTGAILGAEALVRLRTPDGALVAPGVFIPVAEETGLVVQIGEHVLRTALAQLARWGDRLPYVSVNVSPRQLAEPSFVPMLTHTLEASGLQDRSRLVLEITETAVLGTSQDLAERLEAIKRLGVRLALDDFGTGYSSLTWLKAVPADIVKLDRSFVAGLAADDGKASIISAVLWLAKALNMSVVAEGVEDVADWAALGAADCPSAQGYLFSRPVQANDLEDLLSRRPTNPAATAPAVPA